MLATRIGLRGLGDVNDQAEAVAAAMGISLDCRPVVRDYPGGSYTENICSAPGSSANRDAYNAELVVESPGAFAGDYQRASDAVPYNPLLPAPWFFPPGYQPSIAEQAKYAPTAAAVVQATTPPSAVINAPATSMIYNPQVTIANLSRPGQTGGFQVGDRWRITVTGAAPNTQVLAKGGMVGEDATTPMGQTDSNGIWVFAGNMGGGDVGAWREHFEVGGRATGDIAFTVAVATVPAVTIPASTASTSPGTGATGGNVATVPTEDAGSSVEPIWTSITSSFQDFSDKLTSDVTVGGAKIPTWAIGLGAAVAIWLLTSGGGVTFVGGRGR